MNNQDSNTPSTNPLRKRKEMEPAQWETLVTLPKTQRLAAYRHYKGDPTLSQEMCDQDIERYKTGKINLLQIQNSTQSVDVEEKKVSSSNKVAPSSDSSSKK